MHRYCFTVPTNGFAKISQVSLTEGGPLTAAEARTVQNLDEQWLPPYLVQQAQNWNVEGTVSFPQGDNNTPVLTLSDWDATVSQIVSLPVHTGYTEDRLRVRAKG